MVNKTWLETAQTLTKFTQNASYSRRCSPTPERNWIMASLTKRFVETLIDLVEIKLSCLQVIDRDDAKELAALEHARRELGTILPERANSTVVAFPDAGAQRATA